MNISNKISEIHHLSSSKTTAPNFTKGFEQNMSRQERLEGPTDEKVYVDKDTQTLIQDLIDAANQEKIKEEPVKPKVPVRKDSGVGCNLDCSGELLRPFNLSAISEINDDQTLKYEEKTQRFADVEADLTPTYIKEEPRQPYNVIKEDYSHRYGREANEDLSHKFAHTKEDHNQRYTDLKEDHSHRFVDAKEDHGLRSFRKNSLYSDDLIILEEGADEKFDGSFDKIDESAVENDMVQRNYTMSPSAPPFSPSNYNDHRIDHYQDRRSDHLPETDLHVKFQDQLNLDQRSIERSCENLDDEYSHENYRVMTDHSDSISEAGSIGGKDSGCEIANDIGEIVLPSDELSNQIVQQVEFYFSDTNITKDAFLLKHVKRNKEGYVSLKLISSFKRVKHLTKDWRVVANALLNSKKLEINEAGTKVRRIDPLPKYDETAPSRTVVAVNMPVAKPTIENVAELFGSCGEIALIRILRPGNPIPADVRQFMNKNPALAEVDCALVEFITSEAARKAVEFQETTFEGYVDKMKVYQLNNVPVSERKKKLSTAGKQPRRDSFSRRDSDYSSCMSCTSCSETEDSNRIRNYVNDPRYRMRRGSSVHYPIRPAPEPGWMQRRMSATSASSGTSGSDSPYGIYSPRRLSASSREGSETMIYFARRYSNSSVSSSDLSNGNFRRSSSCSTDSYGSYNPRSRSNSMALAYHLPENVVRMPQGPDGSKGFRQRCVTNPTY